MGKIHDALEKSGNMKNLKVLPASRSLKIKDGDAGMKRPAVKPPGRPVQDTPGILDPALITYHDPASVEAEIFKILRTNILFPKTGEPPRSIMVTSAIPGDGKSFVASNLAISIAQGVEEHVLLIDCDMRRSSIHRNFGFRDDVPGLSDYLSKGQALQSLLKKSAIEKLTLLPGGTAPSNPSELLSSNAMQKLLQEARDRYSDRYIIVDSPPPQLTAETAALAKYIDGIILVVRYGSTPKDLVQDLKIQLGKEKILGVVMNGYRIPATERYGYGRYKKYKKYK